MFEQLRRRGQGCARAHKLCNIYLSDCLKECLVSSFQKQQKVFLLGGSPSLLLEASHIRAPNDWALERMAGNKKMLQKSMLHQRFSHSHLVNHQRFVCSKLCPCLKTFGASGVIIHHFLFGPVHANSSHFLTLTYVQKSVQFPPCFVCTTAFHHQLFCFTVHFLGFWPCGRTF